jgi:hypothetical protein
LAEAGYTEIATAGGQLVLLPYCQIAATRQCPAMRSRRWYRWSGHIGLRNTQHTIANLGGIADKTLEESKKVDAVI